MKKKAYLMVLALCAALAITACGTSTDQKDDKKPAAEAQDTTDKEDSGSADSKESEETDSNKDSEEAASGDTRLVSVDDVSKYVTIGEYKGLTLDNTVEAVTDDMVDGRIKEELQNKAEEVTEGSVQNGDVVTINYVGTKDGVAFDGGTANNYELTIGSGTFIDGFEDGIIGMKKGETKDLDLTFPKEYSSEELAGQEVVFHVTLNAIKNAEETAIDDALAKRAMDDENATLDQLRSQVYGGLENQAESNFFNEAGSELLNQAIENSKVTCDPDAVDDMYDQLVTTYTAYAGQYGMELEEFLSMFLQTDKAGLRATAENLVKQEMVLNAIIEAEGIKATDEEKDKLAQMNYFADAEEMVSTYGEESANRLFQMGAAYYYLIDNAVQGAPAGAGETVEGHTESQAAETTAP